MKNKLILGIFLIVIIFCSFFVKTQSIILSLNNGDQSKESTNLSLSSSSSKFLYLSLTPHEPIIITTDSNFTDYGFPGVGTSGQPYIIENYRIVTTEERSISITDTTKYFVIRNCYVHASSIGIRIVNAAEGTVKVVNNTCTNNQYGILLHRSSGAILTKNTYNCNQRYGAFLYNFNSCLIICNNFQENEEYGLYLEMTFDNIIHHNNFVDNNLGGTSQAYDYRENNSWYDSTINEGNFWSDWSEEGCYTIDGPANSLDCYPFDEEGNPHTETPPETPTDTSDFSISFAISFLIPLILIFRYKKRKSITLSSSYSFLLFSNSERN